MEEEEGGEEGLDEAAHEEQVEAYVEQTAQTAQAAAGEGGEEGVQREELMALREQAAASPPRLRREPSRRSPLALPSDRRSPLALLRDGDGDASAPLTTGAVSALTDQPAEPEPGLVRTLRTQSTRDVNSLQEELLKYKKFSQGNLVRQATRAANAFQAAAAPAAAESSDDGSSME